MHSQLHVWHGILSQQTQAQKIVIWVWIDTDCIFYLRTCSLLCSCTYLKSFLCKVEVIKKQSMFLLMRNVKCRSTLEKKHKHCGMQHNWMSDKDTFYYYSEDCIIFSKHFLGKNNRFKNCWRIPKNICVSYIYKNKHLICISYTFSRLSFVTVTWKLVLWRICSWYDAQ